jgi:hypothetical protein
MHGARVECVEDAQVGAGGASPISLEDFATAMVDEPERPRHPHQRFPIGYRTIGERDWTCRLRADVVGSRRPGVGARSMEGG